MTDDLELQTWAADLIDQSVAAGDLQMTEQGLTLPEGTDVDADLDRRREEKKLASTVEDDSAPQEQIILGFVLEGNVDRSARWAAFRQAIGLDPKDAIPERLWTSATHSRIANEIDSVFRGKKGDIRKINGKALIAGYRERLDNEQVLGSFQAFTQAINELTSGAEGLSTNDFDIAVDLLKSRAARGMIREAIKSVEYKLRADRPVEDVVQHLVQSSSQAMSLVKGRLRGDQTFDTPDSMFDVLEDSMTADGGYVIPTGIRAMDINLQGGINPQDPGKFNVIGARTRVGKTTLGVASAMGLCMNGADTLFISCELSKKEIMARALARYSKAKGVPVPSWIMEGRGNDRNVHKNFDGLRSAWAQDQERGSFTVKGDFQADAETMGEYIYAAKAQNPELSAVFIDHFHIMSSMKGYSNRSQEMEARALYLHQVGKACEVDLFVMAQLNRDACLAQHPSLEHINGTDVLAQLATAVWLLEFPKREEGVPFSSASLDIWHAKFRNGQRETCHGYNGNAAGSFISEEMTNVSVDREFVYFTDGTDA